MVSLNSVGAVRLLIVEDEPRMADVLRRGFEEEGYSVDVVHNGPDAVSIALENRYGAIVLDVMLPGCSGYEVCRRLRERNRWAPVIMLTARGGVADRIGGLDAGADDHVTKPFHFDELAARVRAQVRRPSVDRQTVLEVGTLGLDPLRRRAWRYGVEVDLTPRECALLELLMRRCGEVLSRAAILEEVWDGTDDSASNVVDQYIAYLRSKVDRAFGHNDIETVRGRGYRLRLPAV